MEEEAGTPSSLFRFPPCHIGKGSVPGQLQGVPVSSCLCLAHSQDWPPCASSETLVSPASVPSYVPEEACIPSSSSQLPSSDNPTSSLPFAWLLSLCYLRGFFGLSISLLFGFVFLLVLQSLFNQFTVLNSLL